MRFGQTLQRFLIHGTAAAVIAASTVAMALAPHALATSATPCTAVMASSTSSPYGATFDVSGIAATCPSPQYEFWVLPPGYSTWQLPRPTRAIR